MAIGKKNKKSKIPKKNSSSQWFTPPGGKFLNLTRSLDLSDPNVRSLFLQTLLAFLVSWALLLFGKNLNMEQAMYTSFLNGAIYFFTYLLAREVDLERKVSALLAGCCALTAVLFWGSGDPVVLYWLLMLTRLLNRSSGLAAGLFDNLLILLATFYIAQSGLWLYPVITAIVYVVDSQLAQGSHRSLYAAGFAFLIATLVPKFPKEISNIPADIFALMIVSGILYLPVIKLGAYTRTLDDFRNPLNGFRLQAAQILVVLTALSMGWYYGQPALNSMLPVICVMTGTGLSLPLTLIMNKLSSRS